VGGEGNVAGRKRQGTEEVKEKWYGVRRGKGRNVGSGENAGTERKDTMGIGGRGGERGVGGGGCGKRDGGGDEWKKGWEVAKAE